MKLLNFKEIPAENIPNYLHDSFELFAIEFFKTLGFRIVESRRNRMVVKI